MILIVVMIMKRKNDRNLEDPSTTAFINSLLLSIMSTPSSLIGLSIGVLWIPPEITVAAKFFTLG